MPNFLDKQFGRLGNRMFQMAYIYAQYRDGVIPGVYLQDPKYFDKYREAIQSLFLTETYQDYRVGIHVRRGDYVNNDFYTDLSTTDYYQKAVDLFPEQRFLVFSDDIAWCKSYFKSGEFDFSEDRTEEEDLQLMACCKDLIIANSSFSWWAAYLNPNPNKKIIYPQQWYTDGIERTVCPAEWIGI